MMDEVKETMTPAEARKVVKEMASTDVKVPRKRKVREYDRRTVQSLSFNDMVEPGDMKRMGKFEGLVEQLLVAYKERIVVADQYVVFAKYPAKATARSEATRLNGIYGERGVRFNWREHDGMFELRGAVVEGVG